MVVRPRLERSAAARPTLAHAVTVNLTRIYTRLGDDGQTHLGDMSRVDKTHPRIEAYGTIDELNAQLGAARAQSGADPSLDGWLERVQNDLFDLGADISVPAGGERERLRVVPAQVAWLEERCDEINATLAPLRSFLLPGGSPLAAQLHVCRTVCRRAERRTVPLSAEVNPEVVRYLNRLSDLLFILARAANVPAAPDTGAAGRDSGDSGAAGETLWEPGLGRTPPG